MPTIRFAVAAIALLGLVTALQLVTHKRHPSGPALTGEASIPVWGPMDEQGNRHCPAPMACPRSIIYF